jgi:hypothetical protein
LGVIEGKEAMPKEWRVMELAGVALRKGREVLWKDGHPYIIV